MKNLFLSILLIASALMSKAQPVPEVAGGCSDLFFSELTFGKNPNGNIWDLNYAVEIFNPTQSTINLSNYTLELTNSIGGTVNLTLTGSIPAGEVHVVANSSADPNLQTMADQLTAGLDFETTVILELKHNGTTIDQIGQNGAPTAGSIDIVQLVQDPYAYLATFHLDLNDYKNIDIRRGMFVDKGNPTFNSATDIIGKWGYFLNVDRTNIGTHKSICQAAAGEIIGFKLPTLNIYQNPAHGSKWDDLELVTSQPLQNYVTLEYQLVNGPAYIGPSANDDAKFTTNINATSYSQCLSQVLNGYGCEKFYTSGNTQRPSTWVTTKLNSPNNDFTPDWATDIHTTYIKQFTPQGLEEIINNNDIAIYPTIVDNEIFIKSTSEFKIFIYTIEGKILLSSNLKAGNNSLNVNNLPSANYIVKVHLTSGKSYYSKFFKN